MLALLWAHLWALRGSLQGLHPALLYPSTLWPSSWMPLMDISIYVGKPVVSWLFFALPQKPLRPGSTVTILQTESAHKPLYLRTSSIPKDIYQVLPRTFFLCFGALRCLWLPATQAASVEGELWKVILVSSSWRPLISMTGSLGVRFTWFALGSTFRGNFSPAH